MSTTAHILNSVIPQEPGGSYGEFSVENNRQRRLNSMIYGMVIISTLSKCVRQKMNQQFLSPFQWEGSIARQLYSKVTLL